MKFMKSFAIAFGLIALAFTGAAFGAPLSHDDLLSGIGGFGMVGMLVNKENVANLFISLKTTFNNAFDAAPMGDICRFR